LHEPPAGHHAIMGQPPSQAALAVRLGLSRATVSRALRGSPLLPDATRERVRNLAAELGYRPDPLLSALAARRRRPGGAGARPAWALLHTGNRPADAALLTSEAERRGYSLAPVRLPGTAAELDRQLDALDAEAVLVEPLRDDALVRRFDWDRLAWQQRSWLAVGLARRAVEMHVVRGDALEGVALALTRMHARGFRRIAVLREHPRLSPLNELQGAGLAVATSRLPGLILHDCPLLPDQPVPAALAGFQVQAVLTGFAGLHRRLPAGLATLPWASLGLAGARSRGIAGVLFDPALRAAAAADWLDRLIRRRERGLPAQACSLALAPQWLDGRSLGLSPAAPRPG
jgi:transcriptional regulator with XRE-family HTH domain